MNGGLPIQGYDLSYSFFCPFRQADMARVLICGVPYGCDNVGDEAILASIVAQLREMKKDIEIGVVTARPKETAAKLGVEGVPLEFDSVSLVPLWTEEIGRACRRAQVYIHGGATGIHDYPMHMLAGLKLARESGCRTVVYGTGGGPYRHKFWEGRKTRLLRAAKKATLGLVDFRKIAETVVTARYRRAILKGLEAVDLLLVRDQETRQTLVDYGMDASRIHVSGDAAFALRPSSKEAADKIAAEANLWNDSRPVVGVCISSQKLVADMGAVVRMCDAIVGKHGAHVLFVPMNPHTDDLISKEIAAKMERGGETRMIRGYCEPEDMLAFLPRLSVIISSRLHLLIMGAAAGVPPVGIERGSGKIGNFLGRFGLEPAADYLTVDYEILSRRFEDVWSRREDLKRVISAEMRKAADAFREASRLVLPVLES